MNTLLFASSNTGKLAELRLLASSLEVSFICLSDLGDQHLEAPEETGQTFEENALLKARYYAQATSLPTLAEDSGLTLEAFPNFPGVQSARWLEGSDEQRNLGILEKLSGNADRVARFTSVVCLYQPKTHVREFFSGIVRGKIAENLQGADGFGYDPIFIPDGHAKTFAELGVAMKNQLSHRSIAFGQAVSYLRKQPEFLTMADHG
ncbi:RdgB/HAM1 family non-canonical purine NTP pyrophosphatase [Candidatus Woesebacteria bacterium]|nr:RdgB/HAM1 family non-canonical purine NTP pyrophosphatase [Candidatus Woesebacteria bacterium]